MREFEGIILGGACGHIKGKICTMFEGLTNYNVCMLGRTLVMYDVYIRIEQLCSF